MTKIKTTNHKYQLDKFSNISSIESKFDTLKLFKLFYRDFISLKNLEARTTENIDHKPVVLNSALEEYGKLTKEYKNVYEREPKGDKSYGQKKKYGPKNVIALNYQPVKLETESLSDENKSNIKQLMQLEKNSSY